jgi:TIR domain
VSYLVFISHSGEDTWIARKLSADCVSAGAETFLDETQIAVGADFEVDILEALRRADELVVIITPWALNRPYVWLEIGAAWFKGIPIIVTLLGLTNSEFISRSNTPVELKRRNFISLNNIDRYISELAERAAMKA